MIYASGLALGFLAGSNLPGCPMTRGSSVSAVMQATAVSAATITCQRQPALEQRLLPKRVCIP